MLCGLFSMGVTSLQALAVMAVLDAAVESACAGRIAELSLTKEERASFNMPPKSPLF